LKWVSAKECHRFWKEDVKPHLVEPEAARRGFRLEEFPGEYCYVGAEWGAGDKGSVVLLEMHH
jgi:hypothetical protein